MGFASQSHHAPQQSPLVHTIGAFGSEDAVKRVRDELSAQFPDLCAASLRLIDSDRGRIFRFWDTLSPEKRRALVTQVSYLDLDLMERNLKALHDAAFLQSRTAGELAPPTILAPDSDPSYAQALELGEEVLREGWLALVEGAGGTGSRFFKAAGELPKGLYPISPSERFTFFEVRLAQLMALRRRYQKPIPYIVMVSDATRDRTLEYFESHGYFDLKDEIRIVQQRSLPYLEEVSPGHYDLLLETPEKVAVGGYGHADFTKHILLQPDVLSWLKGFGTRYVQWLQIDNPLAVMGHRHLLGAHRLRKDQFNPRAIEMSFISLKKVVATEAAGVLVRRGGGLAVWEYSDMDPVSQHLLEDDAGTAWLAVTRHGRATLVSPPDRKPDEKMLGVPDLPPDMAESVRYRWGAINPNLVVVTLDSAVKHPEDNAPLVAKKSARHLNLDGTPGDMSKKFLKFEAFLFDGLNDGVVVEEEREACFAPTKNADGEVDSPVSARQLMNEHGARRLREIGWTVETGGGTVVELMGLLELCPVELARRVGRNGRIEAGGVLSIRGIELRMGDGLTITATGKLFIDIPLGPCTAPLEQAPRLELPAGLRIEGLRQFQVPARAA